MLDPLGIFPQPDVHLSEEVRRALQLADLRAVLRRAQGAPRRQVRHVRRRDGDHGAHREGGPVQVQ